MTEQAPRTEAGRRLLERLDQLDDVVIDALDDILAIEAEAARLTKGGAPESKQSSVPPHSTDEPAP